jgi:hypothetical protein
VGDVTLPRVRFVVGRMLAFEEPSSSAEHTPAGTVPSSGHAQEALASSTRVRARAKPAQIV